MNNDGVQEIVSAKSVVTHPKTRRVQLLQSGNTKIIAQGPKTKLLTKLV